MNDKSKKEIIENVLGMSLTVEQLDFIADDWKAFYREPLNYKNSVVVDMIKLSLK